MTGEDIASLKAKIKAKYGDTVSSQYAADLITFVEEVSRGQPGG